MREKLGSNKKPNRLGLSFIIFCVPCFHTANRFTSTYYYESFELKLTVMIFTAQFLILLAKCQLSATSCRTTEIKGLFSKTFFTDTEYRQHNRFLPNNKPA